MKKFYLFIFIVIFYFILVSCPYNNEMFPNCLIGEWINQSTSRTVVIINKTQIIFDGKTETLGKNGVEFKKLNDKEFIIKIREESELTFTMYTDTYIFLEKNTFRGYIMNYELVKKT